MIWEVGSEIRWLLSPSEIPEHSNIIKVKLK